MRIGWTKRYPPMLLLVVGVLLTATILPSALNIPQSNPSQTLEYAPVSEDSDAESQDGNFASLGLGSGRGFGGTGGAQTQEESGLATGRGTRPTTKRCVGNPPRQTDDPLAPPCVAFFDGNNGGATYQGVTRDEIRILVYLDGGQDELGTDCQSFEDLAEPADPSIDRWTSSDLRILQSYFNDRFQTYRRFVHLVAYRSRCLDEMTAEARRADAADAFAKVRPFASLNLGYGGYSNEFDFYMAQKGVINFGGNPTTLVRATHFRNYSGLLWAHLPSLDHQARLYTSYVCQKVVPFPVSFGNPEDFQSKRKIGLLYTEDPAYPDHPYLRDLVIEQVERCGGNVELVRGHKATGQDRGAALQNMALFRQNEVTTILWTGHFEPEHQRAAASIGYTPEVIVLGQPHGLDEYLNTAAFGNPAFMRQAWVVSNHTYRGKVADEPCGVAIRESKPTATENDIWLGCERYPHLMQLFVGVQVAGPRLTPSAVEQGFRAIPGKASTNPKSPACFYDTGDFTCVKDAVAEWWDPQGKAQARRASEDGFPGCWRMPEGGKRYLVGTWPAGDVPAQKSTSDPCNSANSP